MFRTVVFDFLGGRGHGFVLHGKTRRRAILPSSPCPAPPLCTRPARGVSGFWVRQVVMCLCKPFPSQASPATQTSIFVRIKRNDWHTHTSGARTVKLFCLQVNILLMDLSSPKPGHSPSGSVRGGARRDGGAGRGRAAQDVDGTVRPG